MAAILIERIKAAIKFGLLRLAQRKVMLFQTVPKLGNQGKALWRRQQGNLVPVKQLHALRVRKKDRSGNAPPCCASGV